MKKSLNNMAHVIKAIPATIKALNGREIDAGAYLVAIAAIEAVTRFGMFCMKLQAGIV